MKLNVPREVLKLDPLDYRLKKENDYLSLFTVACDILPTPISVECIFFCNVFLLNHLFHHHTVIDHQYPPANLLLC